MINSLLANILVSTIILDFVVNRTKKRQRCQEEEGGSCYCFIVLVTALFTLNVMISGGRRKTALSFFDIERVSRFIVNFAEQQSIILPGRISGFKRDDVKVLPSCETKASVWRAYK